MAGIKIGWAEESLVPNKKVSLAGQFYERISETVESEICGLTNHRQTMKRI